MDELDELIAYVRARPKARELLLLLLHDLGFLPLPHTPQGRLKRLRLTERPRQPR